MKEYTLPSGEVVKVVGSNILVERIPRSRESAGGIILNQEAFDATAHGIIRAIGVNHTDEGIPYPIPDVEVGMRCAFLWFHAERHTNQNVRAILGDNFIFLKAADLIVVWPEGEQYDVQDIKSMEH